MKTGIITFAALFVMGGASLHAQEGKTLVVYFSYSGNTREIAGYIKDLTGGDMFEIQTVKPYPTEYEPCTEAAKKEMESNARPPIKGEVNNIRQYDTIFVGCPSWWHTAPMAVLTFLESHDLSGKTVIPFCTHESKEDGAFAAIEKATPDSEHLKGFDCFGHAAKSSKPKVEAWLKEIKAIR